MPGTHKVLNMDTHDKEKLIARINDKIASTKKDIIAFKELIKPVSPDNAIGRLTRMEAINSKSINEAALRKLKITLSNLENALKTADRPDFGLCNLCEEPIPIKRLLIMPESGLCVACAQKSG